MFHAPRPRHYSQTQIQPWLQVLDSAIPRSPSPLLSRVSSPLRPYSEAPQTQSTISDFRSISPPPSGNREHLEVVRPNTLHGSRMDSAARRYVRWMAKVGLKNSTIPSIIFFSIAARWLIGFGGHSGEMQAQSYFARRLLTPTTRQDNTTHVRRLRSSKALDGTHCPSAILAMVQIRPAVLGFRLPTTDCLREPLMWLYASRQPSFTM